MHDLVISPEPFVQKCRSLARAKSIYLEVIDGSVRLAWIDGSSGDQESMERAETIGLGITYDMLEEALLEAGGALDANGRYPINETIRQRLVWQQIQIAKNKTLK